MLPLCFLFFLTLLGCQPRGEIGPQPHRDVQKASSSLNESSKWGVGWGSFCHLKKVSSNRYCFVCQSGHIFKKKCIESRVPITEDSCAHLEMKIKCFLQDGPQAFSIVLDYPVSEAFDKAFLEVLETLENIVTLSKVVDSLAKERFIGFIRLFSKIKLSASRDQYDIQVSYSDWLAKNCQLNCDINGARIGFEESLKEMFIADSDGVLEVQHGIRMLKVLAKSIDTTGSLSKLLDSVALDSAAANH